ncbi:hypothetical protein [Campylobacter corcagiensis]|uniref:Uncharacterized protein n=1 Tax=Campylobacter corcagiensis TaxID=1448857 RepID=A0A7M1LI99_9BACT|nr:hypothetical protein [Campylobacter corcagiensis]QKF64209.1 hypothetical protein CCORG_0322 [Campylobacter corcagiensis]QOQ87596.1 hypothetical protein IMC76_01950 [Campylobacter corcagiensis]
MKNLVFTLFLGAFLVGCANNPTPSTNIQKPTEKFSQATVIEKVDENSYIIKISDKEFNAVSYENFRSGDQVIANFVGQNTIYIRPASSVGGKTLLIKPAKTEAVNF